MRSIFAKKKEAQTGAGGWKCVYDGPFRPFLIPKVPLRCNERGRDIGATGRNKGKMPRPTGDIAGSDSSSECPNGDRSADDDDSPSPSDEEDLRPGDITFWFKEDEPELRPAESRKRTAVDQAPIIDRHRVLSNQHDFISNRLCYDVNQDKYSLLVNTLDAIVTIRWKQSEHASDLWAKFTTDKLKTSGARGGNSQQVAVARSHAIPSKASVREYFGGARGILPRYIVRSTPFIYVCWTCYIFPTPGFTTLGRWRVIDQVTMGQVVLNFCVSGRGRGRVVRCTTNGRS